MTLDSVARGAAQLVGPAVLAAWALAEKPPARDPVALLWQLEAIEDALRRAPELTRAARVVARAAIDAPRGPS